MEEVQLICYPEGGGVHGVVGLLPEFSPSSLESNGYVAGWVADWAGGLQVEGLGLPLDGRGGHHLLRQVLFHSLCSFILPGRFWGYQGGASCRGHYLLGVRWRIG